MSLFFFYGQIIHLKCKREKWCRRVNLVLALWAQLKYTQVQRCVSISNLASSNFHRLLTFFLPPTYRVRFFSAHFHLHTHTSHQTKHL